MTNDVVKCRIERVMNTLDAGHSEYLSDKTDDELWCIAGGLVAGNVDGLPMRAVQLMALPVVFKELVRRAEISELASWQT